MHQRPTLLGFQWPRPVLDQAVAVEHRALKLLAHQADETHAHDRDRGVHELVGRALDPVQGLGNGDRLVAVRTDPLQ